jgi:hypothetical protein
VTEYERSLSQLRVARAALRIALLDLPVDATDQIRRSCAIAYDETDATVKRISGEMKCCPNGPHDQAPTNKGDALNVR